MKIGIITEYYYPLLGGITEHVHHFSIEAKKLGLEPVIITGNAGEDPFVKEGEIEIIRLGRSVPLYSNGSVARVTVGFNIGRKIKELFKSERFDIIHIHSPFVPTLPIMAQLYSNTMTFATFHTQFDSNIFLKTFRKISQRAMDILDGRIAVSKLCIESMNHYLDAEFKVIPNGIDTDKFNGRHEKIAAFDDGKLNIFFLSRLEPRNGLEYLIKAFSILRKKRSDCRLIVGGSGPLKTYYKSLVPSSVRHDIHFVGQINGVRPNYYSTADIFCFPTTKASFGITILEAMASEKPVITFTLPAYEQIIKSGEDGILCGDPDAGNMAMAIDQLLDSQEMREKIGRAARVRAEDYSWKKITKKIVDYYENVTS